MPTPLLYLDRLEEAESALLAGKKLLGNDSMLMASEALLWAKRGEAARSEEALRITFENLQSVSHAHHTCHYAAAASAVLGEDSRAVATLRKAAEAGMPNYPAFMKDPHFASLHEHPEFKELMASLKIGWESFRAEFGED